jgi:hypothetical protein
MQPNDSGIAGYIVYYPGPATMKWERKTLSARCATRPGEILP